MYPDEDSQTTLSKWPFILGDVLLVATALAIAILGDWQLTNWQVASCVISVALGCSLFVLPYIVEHQVRVREELEDRGAEVRILHKRVVNGREEVQAAVERIEAVEVAIRNIDQSVPDLSAPIRAIEKRIDKKLESVEEQHLQLSEQFGAVSKKVDELSAKLKEKLDSKSLQALEAELSSLKKELAGLPAKLTMPPAPEKPSDSKALVEGEAEPGETSSQTIDRPNRTPRERHAPEPRLLKRAIEHKQDKSSSAVSRIIESKPKGEVREPVSEPENKLKPEPKETVLDPESEQLAEPKKVSEPAPEKQAEDKEGPSQAVEEIETPKAQKEEKAQAKQPEQQKLEAERVTEPEKKGADHPAPLDKAIPAKKQELASEPKKEEPTTELEGDMFGESVPAQVKKRVRTKKSDTAVIASVFIGIGNKPFVRGNGAGLNWESGVEMEFEEIGRWRWIAPADLDAPIEIQLYRNDGDPDSTGKYRLEPGQQLELSPVF